MTSPAGEGSLTTRGRHLATGRGLGPRFRTLYIGTAVSLLGNYVAYLTIPLLVLQMIGGDANENATPFSLTYALETLPTLIFGLVGGVVLDRVRLRWAMILADIARAAAFFYLASVSGNGGLGPDNLPTVYAVAFLVGSFSAVFENALFAILPAIVKKEQLAQANGRISATQAAMFASGPMLAGAMSALFDSPAPGLWFNGSTFLFSAVAVYLVGPVGFVHSEDESRSGFIEETLNGLRFLVGERRLRDSTIAAATANLVFGFIESTIVVMATAVLGATNFQIGVLIVAFGLGSILGAGGADRVIRVFGLGRTMNLGLLTMAVGMTLLVFSSFGPAALVFGFVMFVGIGLVNVPIATIRQVYTPASMLGRVITASRALSWGTLPIGALLGGMLADQTNYTTTVRLTPVILFGLALWLFTTPLWSDTFGPTHRRLRTSAEENQARPDNDQDPAADDEVDGRQAQG